jgi:hypothetical protein
VSDPPAIDEEIEVIHARYVRRCFHWGANL